MKKLVLLIFLMSAGALFIHAQQDFRRDFEDIESIRTALSKKPQSPPNAHDGVHGRFLPLLKLDSVVTENQEKAVYTYDANGELLEAVVHFYAPNPATGELEFALRIITEYTANGSYTSTHFRWNSLTLVWENYAQSVRIIDPNAGTIDDSYSTWDAGTGTWAGVERYVFLLTPSLEVYTLYL